MARTHRIAVIAGDGIGTEVMPEGLLVLDAAARKFGINLQFDHFNFSSWNYFEKHGQMLSDDWKDQIGGHDAIFFGAVGIPRRRGQRSCQDARDLLGSLGGLAKSIDVSTGFSESEYFLE